MLRNGKRLFLSVVLERRTSAVVPGPGRTREHQKQLAPVQRERLTPAGQEHKARARLKSESQSSCFFFTKASTTTLDVFLFFKVLHYHLLINENS